MRDVNAIAELYKALGVRREYLVEMMCGAENGALGAISGDYIPGIANAIVDDVASDLVDTADHEEWDMDDVRQSVGRVLSERLGIPA